MLRLAAAALVAAAALLGLRLLWPPAGPGPYLHAEVVRAEGALEVLAAGGGASPLRPGHSLPPGSALCCAGEGGAVHLSCACVLSLGRGGRLRFEEPRAAARRMVLEAGELRYRSACGRSSLAVGGQELRCGVGAEVLAWVAEEGSGFRVLQGTVHRSGDQGEEAPLGPGDSFEEDLSGR